MRTSFIRSAIAAAALVGLGSTAHAALLIKLMDTSGTMATSICDTSLAQGGTNCVGYNAYAIGANFVQLANGTVGDFTFANTSFQSNAPGSLGPLGAFASSTNLNILSAVANQQLIVDVTAFGFTTPGGPIKNLIGNSSQNGYANPTALATQQYGFFIDGTNGGGNTTGLNCAATQLLISNGGCSTSGVFTGIGSTFSLRSIATYNVAAANDNFQASNTVTVTVPEPTSIAIVGTALVALAAFTRRRKSNQA